MNAKEENSIKHALQLFNKTFDEKQKRIQQRRKTENSIIQEKQKIMLPMRKFLYKLMEQQLFVENHLNFSRESFSHKNEPKPFSIREGKSSPSFAPGISLFFEDPVNVEIAITNEADRQKKGLIFISCSSEHPEVNTLRGPFHSSDKALDALATFLARHTVRINSKPV